jgi:ParB/RepB/Spo0J family partition protein
MQLLEQLGGHGVARLKLEVITRTVDDPQVPTINNRRLSVVAQDLGPDEPLPLRMPLATAALLRCGNHRRESALADSVASRSASARTWPLPRVARSSLRCGRRCLHSAPLPPCSGRVRPHSDHTEGQIMTTAVSSPAATTEVAIIPLVDIRRSGNVRQELGDIESLAESIRQHGVLTAVLVERREDGAFELVAGFRRVAAAEVAGLEHIPAVVRDPVAGVQRVSDQLAENNDRCALTDLDVAGAMQQMLDLGASAGAVAERFDTSTDTIDRWRAVLALPAPLLALVRDGTIDVRDVADLGELGDEEEFVAAVVAEIRAGTGARWAVSRVRQQRALAAAAAAAQAKLEKEGCPIVAAPRYDTVTGNSRMQRLGDGVKVSLRQHRKQPCHAAFITSRGEVAYVCIMWNQKSRPGNVLGRDEASQVSGLLRGAQASDRQPRLRPPLRLARPR